MGPTLLLCARDSGERGQFPVFMRLTVMRETGEVGIIATEDSKRAWGMTLRVNLGSG